MISAITDGTKGREYSDTVRDFSSTLHFYSARAYKYVRKVFGKTLPDVRTIGKWHARVEAEPGVTPQALAVLAGEKDRRGNKPLLVGLEMDECAVRQHVEWNKYQRKNEGTVDHPSVDRTGEEVMPAKEALVFMASSLDDTWKVPVAYYFINGLKAQEKKAIVETVLAELQECGAQVVGFTFDGTPTNIAVANMLGCNLGVNEAEMRTSFPHPTAGHNVYVLLDPVHMLKLIRNNLHKQAVFKTANGEVCWKYIKDLYEAQSNGGLALAPKLSDLHVNFQNVKMKADLAIQTISQSVADALLVMKSTNPNFEGAGPTAEFLAVMNDTFDFLNSKDNEESGFKKPIDADNFYIIQPALKYAQEYIKSICLQSGESVLKSQCKTGFLGFLVDIISVQNMYKEYVEEKQLLTCIPVYRLSQDHVETFFGAIRSMGDNNDNPSTICFKSAYKRLLLHNSISGTSKMNVALDDSRILADRPKAFQMRHTIAESHAVEDQRVQHAKQVLSRIDDHVEPGSAEECSIKQYSASVQHRLVKDLKCKQCVEQIVQISTLDVSIVLYHVCRLLEMAVKAVSGGKSNFDFAPCYDTIKDYATQKYESEFPDVVRNFTTHCIESNSDENHFRKFIAQAIDCFLTIRLRKYCKTILPRKEYIRSRNTKMYLFQGNRRLQPIKL